MGENRFDVQHLLLFDVTSHVAHTSDPVLGGRAPADRNIRVTTRAL